MEQKHEQAIALSKHVKSEKRDRDVWPIESDLRADRFPQPYITVAVD
ncbi:MAG: hypothetical protein ACFB12_03370 [Leptolyngbyaceae cyanobacterium]